MLTQYKLKNKLKVLLVESHKAPVVAVQMWVKTGSADEKAGEEGISHFIEHLLFKGTRKYGVGEIAKAVEGSGGELNAYTTFDHTVFHVTMSREDLNVGLECIGEMTGFPSFDPVEINKEREVVIEEIKRSFDSPHSVASQQLFSTLYPKHPYGIPVIGYDKNIKRVKPKTLVDYFNRRYVPSNMTLVIAGDFQKSEIKKQVENYYGGFKSFPLKKVKRTQDAKQKKPKVSYKATEFQEASLNIIFRVPPANHPDIPALDVLGFILGQGDSSRLVRRLRLETPLVNGISAGSYNPLDAGLFAISVYFKAENIFKIHEILLEEINAIVSQPLDIGELNRARLNLEADEVFALETVDGLARKVGVFQTMLNDPNYIQTYLKKIQSLTPMEILKVTRKYLTPENLNVTLMLHKKDEKTISKKALDRMAWEISATLKGASRVKVSTPKKAGAKGKALKAAFKATGAASKLVKHRLPNGALVILKRNSEVPVFDIKAGFLGGLRLEKPEDLGVTALLSNTWTSGSMNYSEQKIAGTIEGCAGSLSAFGGRNSVGLSLEALSVYEDKAWEVFSDVLRTPLFPQEAVTREATLQLEALRTRGDHPSSVASQLFMENIFRGHPYALDTVGTEKSIQSLNSPKVFSHWEKMVSSQNAVLVAVGDFKEDKQFKLFEQLTKALKPGAHQAQEFPVPPLEPRKVFSNSDKEQSHIIVGYRGLSFKDPDRYAIEVLQAILAGQGGRLFIELRDKASLAYTVSPVNMKGIETGYFGAYIGCSPEKGKTAIKMIHQELEKITEVTAPLEEVERAKRYLVGRNHIDLQRNGSQASSILFDEIYGIDCEETFKYAEHLKSVTPEDIKRLAQRLFRAPEVTVAVGPIQPWD
jgi:zinc protease